MAKGKAERNKQILLAALGAGFAAALIYEFFIGGPTPRTSRKVTANSNAAAASSSSQSSANQSGSRPDLTTRRVSTPSEQQFRLQVLLANQTPLDLSVFRHTGGSAEPGTRGSIFAYYIKPPEPPPQEKPPPIEIKGLQPQSAVAGTPRKFTLSVFANKMPADATLYLNGNPRPSKRAGENQLTTDIDPSEYTAPASFNVEVKSQSNPAGFYSAQLQFVIQPSPDPPFKYIGRLGNMEHPETNFGLFEMTATKDVKRAKKGDTISNVWRLEVVAANYVELTQTQYDIKKRIPLQDKAFK
ncbi:MAG TPA: hypothetical protein VKM94_25305 [Blastocatellia bacterium]|nr:hypothetical protein [Blastocatellia bacterium]